MVEEPLNIHKFDCSTIKMEIAFGCDGDCVYVVCLNSCDVIPPGLCTISITYTAK